MRHRSLAILCACLMLAACGTDNSAATHQQPGDDVLPKPDAAGGSVTGMPNPGTPSAPPPVDNLASHSEGAGLVTDDVDAVDPDVPMTSAEAGYTDEIAIPPPETIPTVPAQPPQASDQAQVIPPPPES